MKRDACDGRGFLRRGFLRVGGGCAGMAMMACAGCGSGAVDEPTGPLPGGNVSELAVGSLMIMAGPVVLVRDSAGIFAMSAVCPHAGCPVTPAGTDEAAGLVCNCHGSRFDGTGQVTRGPAQQSLRHYAVDIDAQGGITIRADLPGVAATTRTKVGA